MCRLCKDTRRHGYRTIIAYNVSYGTAVAAALCDHTQEEWKHG